MFDSGKRLITAAFITVPLFIGAGIYIILSPKTYLSSFFSEIFTRFDFANTREMLLQYKVFVLIRNYMCDICWAFSLEAALYAVLERNSRYLSVTLSGIFCIIIELLQKYEIIHGTFDYSDIITELAAIILSYILLRRITNEKSIQTGGNSNGTSRILFDGNRKRKQQEGHRNQDTAGRNC